MKVKINLKSDMYDGLRIRFGRRISRLCKIYRYLGYIGIVAIPTAFISLPYATHPLGGLIFLGTGLLMVICGIIGNICLRLWIKDMKRIGAIIGNPNILKQVKFPNPKFETFDGWCKENNIDPFSINNSRPL